MEIIRWPLIVVDIDLDQPELIPVEEIEEYFKRDRETYYRNMSRLKEFFKYSKYKFDRDFVYLIGKDGLLEFLAQYDHPTDFLYPMIYTYGLQYSYSDNRKLSSELSRLKTQGLIDQQLDS